MFGLLDFKSKSKKLILILAHYDVQFQLLSEFIPHSLRTDALAIEGNPANDLQIDAGVNYT